MKPILFHVHMPKTAGSALNRTVLLPRFAKQDVWLAYGVTLERRKTLDRREAPEGVSFLSGHLPHGWAAPLGRPVVHVSVLRDPVERVVSFLNFVAVADRHGARRKLIDNMQEVAKDDPSLFCEMILEQPHVRLRQSNAMTRLASGMPRLSKRTPGRWRLAKALRNIGSPDYIIGVQEAFGEFAERLTFECEARGLGAVDASSAFDQGEEAEKRLGRVIQRQDLKQGTLDLIRRLNDHDLRLYDAVVMREAKLAA